MATVAHNTGDRQFHSRPWYERCVTSELSSTGRTRHRRLREQGRADRGELFAVLAAGLVAHLGVISDGWPMVIPPATASTGG
jgi:hypothetical protein